MVSELQVIGSNLEEITYKMASNERENVRAFFRLTERLLLFVLVLLCISGPLFVYKTATYIAAPIKRLAEITKNI